MFRVTGKLYEIQMSLCIYKVLLEHSHPHFFLHHPWLLCATMARLSSDCEHMTHTMRIFTAWPFTEKGC